MYKQASNAKMPPLDSSALSVNEVTKEERLDVLLMTGRNALMKMSEKETFLIDVLLISDSFLEAAKAFDASNFINSLHESLKLILPRSKTEINKWQNKGMGKRIVEFYDRFFILKEHFEEQHRVIQESHAKLRRPSARTMTQLEEPVYKKIQEYFLYMREIDRLVISKKRSVGKNDRLGKIGIQKK